MSDAISDGLKEEMIFLPCWCGVFDESTLSTFCKKEKEKKTCNDWRACATREPRRGVAI